MEIDSKIESAAHDVADEFRDGKFAHILTDWNDAWSSIRQELERGCPGFTKAEYDNALEVGFRDSR